MQCYNFLSLSYLVLFSKAKYNEMSEICVCNEENVICYEQVVIHLTDGLDAPYAEMKRKTDELQHSGEKSHTR